MSEIALAEIKLSCGRYYLEVAGIPMVMQGDPCRASLPEECLEPIPEDELEHSTIGGESVKDMPTKVIRFFRAERWTLEMLEYVASVINKQRSEELKGQIEDE